MKILRFVSSGFEQGGVENGIVLTNELLRKAGHEVRTIASDLRPDLPHFTDYEFKSVPTTGLKKIIASTFNYAAYKVTKQALEEFQPDVVLLHTLAQTTAAILFLLKDYPTIVFVHGPEIFTKALLPWYLPLDAYKRPSYELRDLTFSGRLRYWYLLYVCRPLYRLGLRNINQIVALSSYTEGFLQAEGYKTVYIPNGVRMLEPTPVSGKRPTILYAGRLEKYKGIDDLINALPAIVQQVPTVRLQIAGDGTYARELQRLMKRLKLAGHVEFLGHLSQVQMAKAYVRCTLLVMPSTWPETFGKVGIEAMSVGRPVVAADVGGVRDWLVDGKNGFLVEPQCPDQIAEKVITLLTNKRIAAKMAAAAQKTAPKFSIEHMTHNILELSAPYAPKPVKRR